MYMDRIIEVSKASNGFVVSCCVPLKPEAKASGKMDKCCCSPCGPGSADKQYIAKDAAEIADLISDIMPLLDQDFKTESAFDAAFKKATADAEGPQEDK